VPLNKFPRTGTSLTIGNRSSLEEMEEVLIPPIMATPPSLTNSFVLTSLLEIPGE
jgi:hypothetical protein